MKITSVDLLTRRASVLVLRANLQRADIRRCVLARMTAPETLVTAAVCGALIGLGTPRSSGPRHARHRHGGGLLRALALVNRYSDPLLGLIAWLASAFASGRPRTSTP